MYKSTLQHTATHCNAGREMVVTLSAQVVEVGNDAFTDSLRNLDLGVSHHTCI